MSGLIVERVGPGVTVQDLGRCGHMHEGIAPGGALVPELLVASNRALGNDDGAAAIELPISSARLRASDAITVALDGNVHVLAAGESLDVPASTRAIRYLALPGGVDVPLVLGGRGTLLVAGFGGFDGRMLRKGDLVPAALGAPAATRSVSTHFDFEAPLRLIPGPDAFDEESLALLFGATFRVSTALDRVGLRLEGPRFVSRPADRRISMPMVRGALQITADGTPIVLGPDHPTTGGYRVIACAVTADLGNLAARRPGTDVRFVRA